MRDDIGVKYMSLLLVPTALMDAQARQRPGRSRENARMRST